MSSFEYVVENINGKITGLRVVDVLIMWWLKGLYSFLTRIHFKALLITTIIRACFTNHDLLRLINTMTPGYAKGAALS